MIDEANFADTRCRNTVAATKALVLVVSAEDDASSREAALAGGAHGWLPREHVGDELYAEISRMLAAPAAGRDLDGAANVVLPEKSIRK